MVVEGPEIPVGLQTVSCPVRGGTVTTESWLLSEQVERKKAFTVGFEIWGLGLIARGYFWIVAQRELLLSVLRTCAQVYHLANSS